jgi:hypothetical protein
MTVAYSILCCNLRILTTYVFYLTKSSLVRLRSVWCRAKRSRLQCFHRVRVGITKRRNVVESIVKQSVFSDAIRTTTHTRAKFSNFRFSSGRNKILGRGVVYVTWEHKQPSWQIMELRKSRWISWSYHYRTLTFKRRSADCFMKRPRTYRAVNTFHLGYKNQSVYYVNGTSRCLFSDKYKTHKYSVDRATCCWIP